MTDETVAEVPTTPRGRARACIASAAITILMALFLLSMGRTFFGPSGRPVVWDGSIWSPNTSQGFADPYSFSHAGHGLCFFGGLWLLARRRLSPERRWIIAVILEAAWEILENSPIIIDRYRSTTIALDYCGDSVLNSISDVIAMSAGFLFAARFRLWPSVALFLAMEIGCALWVRDNLTLNVVMLVQPVEAIKAWQLAGRPG